MIPLVTTEEVDIIRGNCDENEERTQRSVRELMWKRLVGRFLVRGIYLGAVYLVWTQVSPTAGVVAFFGFWIVSILSEQNKPRLRRRGS